MEPLDVVHIDDTILVLNKPTGLLTVTGTKPGTDDCLESRAEAAFPGARLVHRLDWDTSGLIVFGMTAKARAHLGRQFEDRVVDKTYVARVWGHPMTECGTISLPMRCDWPNRPRQIVDHEQGREAITRWSVIRRDERTSDLLLKPHTGRSHQLRVHCLSIGLPILADRLYAPQDAYEAHDRMCLHATELTIYHPSTGERVTFNSPVPF